MQLPAPQYRVEELARAAGVRVDTVRFYQTRGLLPPPERRGRIALYSGEHLERLRRIRALNRRGLKLEALSRLLAQDPAALDAEDEASPARRGAREGSRRRSGAQPRAGARGSASRPAATGKSGGVRGSLLRALEESEDQRGYARAELEAASGAPAFLLSALEQVGLLAPLAAAGARYVEADRETLESARILLDAGLPLAGLLELAREHVEHVQQTAERAVALFEAHVREAHPPQSPAQIAETLRRLLPAVTRLVAVHFERTVLTRARQRLRAGAELESPPSGSRR